jgi:ferredoxin|tara:strand:+ start:345 stop:821 length:477 start_codon:yes stop_codon:yes gene_type:complete
MSNSPVTPSGEANDFFLDGLAGTQNPDFQLEPDAAQTALPKTQTELQLPLVNPEQPEPAPQFEFDGMAKPVFTIHIATDTLKPQQVHFRSAKNLLESLEAQNIQVPYQCREGYCGACRCKKISGQVTYIKEPMAWINDDEILPCVSIPTSDLTLKFRG